MPDDVAGLAAALLASTRPEEVLAVVTGRAEALGATLVTVSLLDPDGATLRLVSAHNAPAAAFEEHASFPLDPATITGDALLRGVPIFLTSRSGRERLYPALTRPGVAQEATATLPLSASGRTVGAMRIAFDEARTFAVSAAAGHPDSTGDDRAVLALRRCVSP